VGQDAAAKSRSQLHRAITMTNIETQNPSRLPPANTAHGDSSRQLCTCTAAPLEIIEHFYFECPAYAAARHPRSRPPSYIRWILSTIRYPLGPIHHHIYPLDPIHQVLRAGESLEVEIKTVALLPLETERIVF
jgi:hypothetical protein